MYNRGRGLYFFNVMLWDLPLASSIYTQCPAWAEAAKAKMAKIYKKGGQQIVNRVDQKEVFQYMYDLLHNISFFQWNMLTWEPLLRDWFFAGKWGNHICGRDEAKDHWVRAAAALLPRGLGNLRRERTICVVTARKFKILSCYTITEYDLFQCTGITGLGIWRKG